MIVGEWIYWRNILVDDNCEYMVYLCVWLCDFFLVIFSWMSVGIEKVEWVYLGLCFVSWVGGRIEGKGIGDICKRI